jgi:hypothetical protein
VIRQISALGIKPRLTGPQRRLERTRLLEATVAEEGRACTSLKGVNLYNAKLQGALLTFAKMDGAILRDARLQGADLSWASLVGADFNEADLQGANLARANLQVAELSLANLQGVSLLRAKLQGAKLTRADLRGSSLVFAEVWRTFGVPKIDPAELSEIDAVAPPWQNPFNPPEKDPIRQREFFATWLHSVLQLVPAADSVRIGGQLAILAPDLDTSEIEARLSSEAAEPTKVLTPAFWQRAVLSPPPVLAKFVAELGCASVPQPYLAQGLVRQGRWIIEQEVVDPWIDAGRARLAVLTDRLQKGSTEPTACAGTKGLTDDDRDSLHKLIALTSKGSTK